MYQYVVVMIIQCAAKIENKIVYCLFSVIYVLDI